MLSDPRCTRVTCALTGDASGSIASNRALSKNESSGPRSSWASTPRKTLRQRSTSR